MMKHELPERSPLSEKEEASFAELTNALDRETALLIAIKSELKIPNQANDASETYRSRVLEAQERTCRALETWFEVVKKPSND